MIFGPGTVLSVYKGTFLTSALRLALAQTGLCLLGILIEPSFSSLGKDSSL
jgi:hypothetical protein|tara:strand:- start:141 stop:293 length:153 start_codon:yes stop_codon:yes gene_type:complete